MNYEELKEELGEGIKTEFKLTREEIDSIVVASFGEGRVQERLWHENPGNSGLRDTMQDDKFYKDPVYESGFPALPYSLKGRKRKPTAVMIKQVSESAYGLRTAGSDQLNGRGNKYVSQEQLFLIQDAAYLRAHTDPLGTSIVQNFVNFVIGRGANVDCFVPEIEAYLREFRNKNDMSTKEEDMVKNTFINGEFFLKLKIKDNGVRVYGTAPQNVVNMESNEDDYSDILAYNVLRSRAWNSDKHQFFFDGGKSEWFRDFRHYLDEDAPNSAYDKEIKTDTFIQFLKVGNYDEVRGRSPFQPVLRYLKYAEDFTIDRLRLNHERSKVIMVKTVTGNDPTQLNPYAAPRGGIVLIATANVRYEFLESHIDADDAKEDGMWILHHIGAGVVMPVHILQQRADQGVYAAIKKMDSPFTQNILKWQDFFEREWSKLNKFVLKHAVDSDKLKKAYKVPAFVGLDSGTSTEASEFFQEISPVLMEMVHNKVKNNVIIKEIEKRINKAKLNKNIMVPTENIPVSFIFPDTVKDNPLEMAKVLFLHRRMGLVSASTAAKRAGYDWRAEISQMAYEKAMGITPEDDNAGKGVSSEKGKAGAGDEMGSGSTGGSQIKI